ncbi:hypothetical protein CONPUDRAFT_93636 [Coniophora puteana RWD-64-598 SS2]|uniref:Histone chaperone RTT106/FACT complex subunit SPT16-like middle domain-containing protein n=1 Tax=Coniophora puteana (strain RWD-64-598) TaxID=741705 RepID=A0A5M3M6S2_CONPW|nr:uncharacterized protein CONPUDRAFT_93636 [Coniophora puteana RWD-64-598 SS2]EIW74817.1 hypothetical protein CONPUDRAFT_93636 [Coniophora puteana RWD-64-598 SS2]
MGQSNGATQSSQTLTSAAPSQNQRQAQGADAEDDAPVFTLSSVSATSPVRKKVHITIHERTLRFVNPTSSAREASVPLSSLSRAFLVPTRGKTKPHWTVILMLADEPEKGAPSSIQQVIFGLDATCATPLIYTEKKAQMRVEKGKESITAIRDFLKHLPSHVTLHEPSTAHFRSACPPGLSTSGGQRSANERAAVEAYLGAKVGTLWFFDEGMLWGESKPCEFWPVHGLASKDGLRVVSPTGRTCSVILRRVAPPSEKKGGGDGESDEEEEEGPETEFTMIDGREQEPIQTWIRARAHRFGRAPGEVTSPVKGKGKGGDAANPKAPGGSLAVPQTAANGPAWDDSDSEDEDFNASDDGDDGDDSDADSDDSGSGGEDDDNDAGRDEDDDSDDEVEELDPRHHPLLRAGAVPRLSRAAVDAVVDMMGGGGASPARAGVEAEVVADSEDEEDELMDE